EDRLGVAIVTEDEPGRDDETVRLDGGDRLAAPAGVLDFGGLQQRVSIHGLDPYEQDREPSFSHLLHKLRELEEIDGQPGEDRDLGAGLLAPGDDRVDAAARPGDVADEVVAGELELGDTQLVVLVH